MRVLIDGRPVDPSEAAVSVFDWGTIRGSGIFEVIRSYDGKPFRLDAHLRRLKRSAAGLHMPTPDTSSIEEWVRAVAAEGGDCQVRIVITAGGRDPLVDAPSRIVVMWEPVPEVPATLSVLPTLAPWHPAGAPGGFAGVKWLSYAPNMACTDAAQRAGFHDALLLSSGGSVLEGPTFTVGWITDGVFETPTLDLGILASITREAVLEAAHRLGLRVHEGDYPLDRVLEADEVVAMSTVKEVTPIERIGECDLPLGPFAPKLRAEYAQFVADELA